LCFHCANKYELFNLWHAQAQNVIERIFGVLKRKFQILHLAPESSIEIQSHIPSALVSIHNFIWIHTSDKETHLEDGGLVVDFMQVIIL
jgi:hypothetical protein